MLKQGDVGKIQGNGDVVCWQCDGWRNMDALMSRAAGWLEGEHTKQISLSSKTRDCSGNSESDSQDINDMCSKNGVQ